MSEFKNENVKGKNIAFASDIVKEILEKNGWDLRLSIKGEMTGFGIIVKDKDKDAEFLIEISEVITSGNITKNGKKCHFLEFVKMGEEVEVTGIIIPNMVIPGKDGGYISMVAEKANNTGVMLGDGSGQGKIVKYKLGFSVP